MCTNEFVFVCLFQGMNEVKTHAKLVDIRKLFIIMESRLFKSLKPKEDGLTWEEENLKLKLFVYDKNENVGNHGMGDVGFCKCEFKKEFLHQLNFVNEENNIINNDVVEEFEVNVNTVNLDVNVIEAEICGIDGGLERDVEERENVIEEQGSISESGIDVSEEKRERIVTRGLKRKMEREENLNCSYDEEVNKELEGFDLVKRIWDVNVRECEIKEDSPIGRRVARRRRKE